MLEATTTAMMAHEKLLSKCQWHDFEPCRQLRYHEWKLEQFNVWELHSQASGIQFLGKESMLINPLNTPRVIIDLKSRPKPQLGFLVALNCNVFFGKELGGPLWVGLNTPIERGSEARFGGVHFSSPPHFGPLGIFFWLNLGHVAPNYSRKPLMRSSKAPPN